MSKAPKSVDRSDWLLLALAAAPDHSLTPVQLQKSLFLLGDRRSAAVKPEFYDFAPYDYGPFCRDVYDDADRLSEEGLLRVENEGGRNRRRYVLTVEGERRVKTITTAAPEDGAAYLARVVQWATSLSFGDLVRAIYDAYPNMRARSVFQG